MLMATLLAEGEEKRRPSSERKGEGKERLEVNLRAEVCSSLHRPTKTT